MRHVIWGSTARHDLRRIIDHYGSIDADLPVLLIERIDIAAASLLEFPAIGPTLTDSTYRRWHAKGTPFILFYRVTRQGIRILEVRHARSDWKPR